MKPAEHDIDVYRGDTFELFFRVRTQTYIEGTGFVPGAYKDLTGQTPTGMIRATEDSVSAAATFTCSLANQTTTPGGVLCRLAPADTSALTISEGVYDIQLTDGTDVWTYVKGKVSVDKDVTHA